MCLLRGTNCISEYNSSHFSTVKELSTLLVSEKQQRLSAH
jgi:hypothetical protein